MPKTYNISERETIPDGFYLRRDIHFKTKNNDIVDHHIKWSDDLISKKELNERFQYNDNGDMCYNLLNISELYGPIDIPEEIIHDLNSGNRN